MKTVLIIDRDLGFLAFVSQLLTHAGYVALPATTSYGAVALLKALENSIVDLLMVNFNVGKAATLARTLKKHNHLIRVVSIGHTNIRVDATLRKPSPSDSIAWNEWLLVVKHVLGEQ